MAHVKIISPNGWEFDGPACSMLKLGSDGRMGPNDRREFQKRAGVAGSNIFENEIARLKFAKDTIPVHLIALGAKEAYGPNRNGDAFTEATLKQAHDTFVKYAHWFRNHKNKKANNDPHFGCVKCSAYNPQMRRVELLCELPTTKEAADRLGCNGPADKEMEKLARGEDIAVSMACRVPYDVCSGCGNMARTREEYCKEASCKFGGCLNNLTKLVKMAGDAHILHVENPNPIFFDISNVFRPADRIAYAGKADYLTKAASDGGFFDKQAEFALGVTAPISVILAQDNRLPGEWKPALAEQIKIAQGLASLDQQPEKFANDNVKRAFAADVQPDVDLVALELDSEKPEKVAAALGALADQKILLSLRDFARMTKRASLTDDAGKCLRGVYYRMIEDGTLERRLANNRYAPAEKMASAKQRTTAARMASTYSLEKAAVARRVQLSTVRGVGVPAAKSVFWNEKTAHDSPLAEELARDYACYKVAALRRISQFDDEFVLTARLSACQNQVI